MPATTLFDNGSLSVIDYRCTATPADKPYVEGHTWFSLAYVRKGSFGCCTGGRSFDLVPGSLFVGRPGDEYVCSHDHHVCGDECLSFSFAPMLADAVEGDAASWRVGVLPPLAALMPLGELAQAVADGRSDLSLEEAGALLLARFLEVVSGEDRRPPQPRSRMRRRMIETAIRIAEQSAQPLALDRIASWAGLSSFHFLRMFTQTLGLTPHQYLIRCRLRQAGRLLVDRERSVTGIALDVGFDDLSHFIRTFRAAAGVSPRRFRELANGDHGKMQAMLGERCQLLAA